MREARSPADAITTPWFASCAARLSSCVRSASGPAAVQRSECDVAGGLMRGPNGALPDMVGAEASVYLREGADAPRTVGSPGVSLPLPASGCTRARFPHPAPGCSRSTPAPTVGTSGSPVPTQELSVNARRRLPFQEADRAGNAEFRRDSLARVRGPLNKVWKVEGRKARVPPAIPPFPARAAA
jgi:hypothetical protein